MRRLPRPLLLLALLGPLALPGLAGCGDEAQEATGDLGAVQVEPTDSGVPTLRLPEDFAVTTSASRVVTEGEGGDVVEEGDVIGMQYLLYNGRTGEQVATSNWTAAPTSLVADETILTGLRTGLVGKEVGSGVLVAVAPDDGFAGQGQPPANGVEATDTLVFYVDVESAVPPRAQGTEVTPPPGLPTVARDAEGAPTITIPPGAAPPDKLVAQQLITGNGAAVKVGQTIRVQYTGVKWADGQVFDSSWTGSPVPFVIGQGQVIKGWDAGLINQPVGSQVLLIVPPSEGYGEAGQPSAGIGATDTLVFVVDILAAG